MKLYTYDEAPNPKRITYFVKYKGIQIDTVQIDMMKGEHLNASFKEINPLATLPTLISDEGELLTEVIGICCYLEAHFPEKPLMGNSAIEKAQVISWDHRIFMEGFSAIAETLRNKSPAFVNRALPGPLDIPQIPELIPRGELRASHFFTVLDQHLASREFIVGDSVTLADIDALTFIGFAKWIKLRIPEECGNLLNYHKRIKSLLD